MAPAVFSSFDIADWLIRQARQDGVALSPLKLQRLLYFAQARYAGLTGGKALMPSLFVVSALGPIEPNLYRAFEHDTPRVTVQPTLPRVEHFLRAFWQQYGARPVEQLNRESGSDPAYLEAEPNGIGAPIPLALMRLHHCRPEKRPIRIVEGKRVRRWIPGAAAPHAAAI
jgi:hypothetical protein